MELDKFIVLFSEQFDSTSSDEFSPSTLFKGLDEWGSLTALSIMAMVDEELEIRITGADIRNSESIEDLYNLIISKQS
jgi:acyl carrier protein